ncbi:MAG TPA: hypothetical protein VF637_02495, partial [Sphingomicrobium sp.]
EYLLRASTGNTFWLNLVEGATRDPKILDATRRLGRDYGSITPEQLQETARKYLRPETEWSFAVVPAKKPPVAAVAPNTPAAPR